MKTSLLSGTIDQFVRASCSMGALYVMANLLAFATGIMLARLLGVAAYGSYALAMTSATLAGIVTEFGLPSLVMRETGRAMVSQDWSELKGLLRWADRVILTISALAVAGLWFSLGRHAEALSDYARAMLWGVLVIPAVAIGKMRAMVLLALGDTMASQLPQMVLRPLLFILGCLGLWRWHGQLSAASAMAVQLACALVVMLISLLLMWRRRPAALTTTRAAGNARHWLAICLPMGASEGLRVAQGQIGLLLVGALAGPAAAGVYRVADAVTQVTQLATSSVATAASPTFAGLWARGDRAGLRQVARLSSLGMACGTLVLGAPVALAGQWLFPLLFGRDFSLALPPFILLWSGAFVTACFGLAIPIANMTGHHALSTRAMMLVVGANLVIGVLTIHAYGAIGGAAATAISMALGAAWCARRLRNRIGLNTTLLSDASA